MEMPDYLVCLLRTCMWVKKQQLEPCMEQLIVSRSRNEYDRAVYCHPVCLIYTLSTSWEILGGCVTSQNQDSGRNINNLRYVDDATLMTTRPSLIECGRESSNNNSFVLHWTLQFNFVQGSTNSLTSVTRFFIKPSMMTKLVLLQKAASTCKENRAYMVNNLLNIKNKQTS